MVGTVQNRKVAQLFELRARLGQTIGAQALDARHHALGLVVLGVGVDHPYRLALTQVAPQIFRIQLGVGAYDVIGRTQNGRGAAVVLLELDDLELGEILGQETQVVQGGTAPAVNTLVIVAHGGEAGGILARRQAAIGLAAHQQLEHGVLGGIGVLVFVDQHMAHLRLPLGADLGVIAQQFQRQADQVVKVHALVGAQALLVAAHHHSGDALAIVGRLRQGLLGVEARTFPRADGPLPGPGRRRVGAATGVFQDAGDVVGIQNAELWLEPQHRAVGAQHAHP